MRHQFASWLEGTNDLTSRFVAAGLIPDLINVAGGLPEPSLFPVEQLAEMAARAIRENPGAALAYGPTGGLPALREAIAARYRAHGIAVDASNVLMTASGTQALDLIGKILIEPGSVVVGDFPTYAGALDAFRPREPAYRTIDLEDETSLAALDGAAMVYMIPNFSNPTGHLIDLPGRERLVAACEERGLPVVEDDPYGAMHYDQPALPSLLELSARNHTAPYEGNVIQLGTLSKQLVPGLRVGWVVAAPDVIAALTSAKQATDLCSNGLAQLLTLDALEHGLIEELHPRAIATYRARRDALCAAMEKHIGEWFTWERPIGGMFVWALARDPSLDVDAIVDKGVENGVLVGPGNVFDPLGVSGPALRLNFTLNAEDKLEAAMVRLRKTLVEVTGKS